MNIGADAARARVSVRSYDGSALSAEEGEGIVESFGEALPGPFGGRPRFLLVGAEAAKGERVGTYGVISGSPAFVIGAIARGPDAMADFGYCLEGIVLRATEMGLGTCWLGGIFDRGAIGRALAIGRGDVVPACTPVGHPADRLTVQDRLIRYSAGSRTRKPATDLFFEPGGGEWKSLEDPGPWSEVLEAVRIAPSASNKQPWRLLLERGDSSPDLLHLYLAEDRFYNNMLGAVKLQELDMGIAMRHVEVASTALGIEGAWSRREPRTASSAFRYIATWTPR
jgi:hypothetical protein